MVRHTGDNVAALARRAAVFVAPEATPRSAAHTLWAESVSALVGRDLVRPPLLDALGGSGATPEGAA